MDNSAIKSKIQSYKSRNKFCSVLTFAAMMAICLFIPLIRFSWSVDLLGTKIEYYADFSPLQSEAQIHFLNEDEVLSDLRKLGMDKEDLDDLLGQVEIYDLQKLLYKDYTNSYSSGDLDKVDKVGSFIPTIIVFSVFAIIWLFFPTINKGKGVQSNLPTITPQTQMSEIERPKYIMYMSYEFGVDLTSPILSAILSFASIFLCYYMNYTFAWPERMVYNIELIDGVSASRSPRGMLIAVIFALVISIIRFSNQKLAEQISKEIISKNIINMAVLNGELVTEPAESVTQVSSQPKAGYAQPQQNYAPSGQAYPQPQQRYSQPPQGYVQPGQNHAPTGQSYHPAPQRYAPPAPVHTNKPFVEKNDIEDIIDEPTSSIVNNSAPMKSNTGVTMSSADSFAINQYKKMYESGIITLDEYEKMKNKIMNK